MRILLTAATFALIAGCSSTPTTGAPTAAGSTTAAGESTTAAGESTSAAPTSESAPTGTVPSEGKASAGAALSVTGIRTGQHDGFDRVVFEFGGQGTPGWVADYTTAPSSPGSGKPIDVKGQSVLQVRIKGVGYPSDTGVTEYSGPNPAPGAGSVTEVNMIGVFEGESEAFIGIEADHPAIRIFTLSSPTRLVVDIAG